MGFAPLSDEEERIATAIVDSAFAVHSKLGPGLLESIYETCLCYELRKRNLRVRQQLVVPIHYDDLIFDEGFRLDVLVEDLAICEIKAVERVHPVFEAQILTYLKLMSKRLGFLINFNVPLIKDGIQRIIL